MKKVIDSAAYESPKAKEVLIEMEGALCVSFLGITHDDYEDGGTITF